MLILGANVSQKKAALLALQAIYGVGKNTATAICSLVGISPQTKLHELNSSQLDLLAKSCRGLITSNKKREKIESIKALVKISSFRGTRHINALPCRGQRTRTNAFTCKNQLSKIRPLLK